MLLVITLWLACRSKIFLVIIILLYKTIIIIILEKNMMKDFLFYNHTPSTVNILSNLCRYYDIINRQYSISEYSNSTIHVYILHYNVINNIYRKKGFTRSNRNLKVSTQIYQFAQVIKVGWPSPVINGCRRRHHWLKWRQT